MGVYILSRNLLKMTDAQTHLKSAIEQRDNIVKEISELQNQINSKRELGLKVQGIIEYLEHFTSEVVQVLVKKDLTLNDIRCA